jgi:hypothetical protein
MEIMEQELTAERWRYEILVFKERSMCHADGRSEGCTKATTAQRRENEANVVKLARARGQTRPAELQNRKKPAEPRFDSFDLLIHSID